MGEDKINITDDTEGSGRLHPGTESENEDTEGSHRFWSDRNVKHDVEPVEGDAGDDDTEGSGRRHP